MDHGEVFEIGSKRTRVLSLRALPALYGRLDFRWVTTRHKGWTSNSVKKEPYGEVECGKPIYSFRPVQGTVVLHHTGQTPRHPDG